MAFNPNHINHNIFKKLITSSRPILLDVGANDGHDTCILKKIFPNSVIHSFEPDPRAINSFRIKTRELQDVTLHEIAMNESTGIALFYQSNSADFAVSHKNIRPNGWDLSGSLCRPKKHLELHPEIVFDTIITVPTITIDQWTTNNDINHIDLLWMDVQGAEAQVLTGAQNSLKNCDLIYTEFDEEELYEGQVNLQHVKDLLMSTHLLLLEFKNDALFLNRQRYPVKASLH